MADRTPIEWTDATWNVINGCSVVSPGCTNCYAMRLAGTRFRNHPTRQGLTTDSKAGPVWNGEVRFNEKVLTDPLRWTRPRRIFVCATGDLFHENVPDEWIDRVFAVMALAPQHVFQILTKRPERMREYLAANDQRRSDALGALVVEMGYRDPLELLPWPLPNVWLGVSAEDQARADDRIPILLNTPAAIRWLSAEPLLAPIDLTNLEVTNDATLDALNRMSPADHWRSSWAPDVTGTTMEDAIAGFDDWGFSWPPSEVKGPGLDWVVAGGESGPGARPMHPDWARQLRDQCAAADVPFLFKQWGDWGPVCDLDTDALDDRLYHPAPARSPEASRRPKTAQLVMHASGERFEGARFLDRRAYEGGNGAMLMFEIGKKLAGRCLDGQIHDGFPEAGS